MEHQIIKYFSLSELVSKAVLKKYGELAWSFFDSRLLDVLVWLREGVGISLVCNTSVLQQRGFRENTSEMVSGYTKLGKTYCSAHCLGKGVDLSSPKMTAEQLRLWIKDNIDSCPWPIRIEDKVNWLHIDVMNTTSDKLVVFKV